jgi:hypothetical protein
MKGHDNSQPIVGAAWRLTDRMPKGGDMKRAFPLIALLAACSQQPSPPSGKQGDATAPAAKSAEPAAKAFVFNEKNDLIDFHYGWSAEVTAIPQLADRSRKGMEKVKAELIAGAKEDKAFRDKEGYDFNAYSSSTDYKTAGESPRLLSLSVEASAYTGGAHGNSGTTGLLWDRWASKEIAVADLFAAAANMNRLLTQPWCNALNRAREEKRGEPVGGEGMFDECPKLSDIAIIPTDKDGNGKFERLELIASPYVAGPYVEGSYEIVLPVTQDLITAIRSDYRENFEAQPQ